jgi:hypothetical protein
VAAAAEAIAFGAGFGCGVIGAAEATLPEALDSAALAGVDEGATVATAAVGGQVQLAACRPHIAQPLSITRQALAAASLTMECRRAMAGLLHCCAGARDALDAGLCAGRMLKRLPFRRKGLAGPRWAEGRREDSGTAVSALAVRPHIFPRTIAPL